MKINYLYFKFNSKITIRYLSSKLRFPQLAETKKLTFVFFVFFLFWEAIIL